jgi:hypothetical protein
MRYFVQGQGMRPAKGGINRRRHEVSTLVNILGIFRGLKSEHNAEIGQNSHLWVGTNSLFCPNIC